MRFLTNKQFLEAVETVLGQAICNQAWLGYGNPYFLGFGSSNLPSVVHGVSLQKQKQPDYRLKSYYSSWLLTKDGGLVGQSKDLSERAEASISTLVGKSVSEYLVLPDQALIIHFNDDVKLITTPYQSTVARNAWGVREPDGFVSIIMNDGRMYQIHEKEPPEEYRHLLHRDNQNKLL